MASVRRIGAVEVAGERGFAAAHEAMLDDARARTGLEDFGGGSWKEDFDRVLEGVDRLGLDGEFIARTARKIGSFLDSRLYSQRGWTLHPECLTTPVRQPVIIAGLVRSGTTALHKLMSMDPQFQTSEYWLVHCPMPRPPRAQWASVPAYRMIAGYLGQQIVNAPALKEDKNLVADEAEETIFLLAQSFANNIFPSLWDLPDYDACYRGLDETPHYHRLADNLRLLAHGGPDKRWLIKNPTDLHSLDAVLNVFPDARIIQTHRDPVQAIPSVAALIHAARRAMSGSSADPARVGRREASFWESALERADQARARAEVYIDVDFREFVGDQLGTVRCVYDQLRLELTSEVEGRMRAWLDANPRRSQSMQRVQPEDYGLSRDELEQRYAPYRTRHGYA